MRINRRRFLEVSTGAAALFSAQAGMRGEIKIASQGKRECVLLDLEAQCCLGESFLGYGKILANARVVSTGSFPKSIIGCPTVIVPAAGMIDFAGTQYIKESLRAGSLVLFESGGGFLTSVEFARHQQLLERHLKVVADSPVNLWAGEIKHGSNRRAGQQFSHNAVGNFPAPYIDYNWPIKAKVRDFSRVVPLAEQYGEVIGVMGKLPIALRKRVGKGTLVFLGSPIGPHLHAGDSEAERWLKSVLAG